MSDVLPGIVDWPLRTTHPTAPEPGRVFTYTYDDGAGSKEPYFMLNDAIPRRVVGATGPQGPQGDQGDKGDTGDTGPQGPAGAMTVEGVVFETTDVTLPNSTAKQTIYSNVINHSTTGDCYLLLGVAYKGYSASSDMEFDVEYDGQIIDPEIIEEPKDTSTAQSHPRTFPYGLGAITSGPKTINLRFSKEATGGTAVLKAYTAIVVRYT